MKKIMMTLAIVVSSLFAFAGEGNVDENVLKAFNKEFNGAKEVTWSQGSDFYRAAFVLNDQYISAFYNLDGELVALTRNISSLNLPLNLQHKIRNDYGNYWITDLFEVSNREGTYYYITLEKADTQVVLKSNGDNNWSVFKKATKV